MYRGYRPYFTYPGRPIVIRSIGARPAADRYSNDVITQETIPPPPVLRDSKHHCQPRTSRRAGAKVDGRSRLPSVAGSPGGVPAVDAKHEDCDLDIEATGRTTAASIWACRGGKVRCKSLVIPTPVVRLAKATIDRPGRSDSWVLRAPLQTGALSSAAELRRSRRPWLLSYRDRSCCQNNTVPESNHHHRYPARAA